MKDVEIHLFSTFDKTFTKFLLWQKHLPSSESKIRLSPYFLDLTICARERYTTIAECDRLHEVNIKSHSNTESPLTSSSIPLTKGSGKDTEESDMERQLWEDGEESTRKRRENGTGCSKES